MFLRRISAAAKVSSDSAPTLKSVWKYKQVWSNKPKALYTGSQLQNKTPSIGYHECQGSSRCSINSSRHGSIHKLSKIGKKTPRFNISDQVEVPGNLSPVLPVKAVCSVLDPPWIKWNIRDSSQLYWENSSGLFSHSLCYSR